MLTAGLQPQALLENVMETHVHTSGINLGLSSYPSV